MVTWTRGQHCHLWASVTRIYLTRMYGCDRRSPAGAPLGSEAGMDWADRGPCRAQPERMFAEGAAQDEAKAVCVDCPVRLDCLAYALDNREEYGVWGAMTGRERRTLLRRRPAVTSWAEIFAAARTHEDAALLIAPRPARRTPSRAAPAPKRRSGTPRTGLDR